MLQPDWLAVLSEVKQRASQSLSGTILLVGAQDTVRGLTREVLQRYGYTVREASDASEALAICKHRTTHPYTLTTKLLK
ncbi:MAG TPA: hypothetical protein VJ692_06955 [Nitrospiraceae bacterium]|nr:hypothetical protein [Nitrospiraceae bacterium]